MVPDPLRACVLVLCILTTGCDQQAAFDRLVPRDEAAFAERYLSLLARGDLDRVEAGLSPHVLSAAIHRELAELSETFPRSVPVNTKLVGSLTEVRDETWRAQFTFEYEYPGEWLLAGVAMHRDGPDLFVDGINVERIADSVENTHRFTFHGKTSAHLAIVFAAAAVAAFIVLSLVQCVRAPANRFKWLWTAFILLGLGTVSLNWTTGTWEFFPIHVLLFGVGVQKTLYAPWFVQVAVPVGAIAFQFRQRLFPT